MSFMSGVMMGVSVGSTIHEAFVGKKTNPAGQARPMRRAAGGAVYASAPVQVPEFALVSSLQGRRRYRMAALVNNNTFRDFLEKKLVTVKGIKSVKINTLTGSLLIEYSCSEAVVETLMNGLRKHLVPVNEPQNPPAPLAPTTYSRSWKSTATFLNEQVRKLTGDSLDVPGLVSLIFLVRGIRKVLLMEQRPAGPSMIWWAIHLMKGWRG